MYDVIVVGAGPAGSAAAKRCAEHGLKTLILEKRSLPRDKVCSGMVMGSLAQGLIKKEFGDLPETVLTQPGHVQGYSFHVPGIGSETLENLTWLTWRKDLDYWMNQKAQAGGVEIWQGAGVVEVKHQGQGFSVIIEMDKKREELEAEFIVGADGAASIVRQFLFPELKTRYAQVYQEHYRGELDLDRDYFHWFYPLEISPASLSVHQKDGLIVMDVGGRPGQTNELLAWAKNFLAEHYGFDVNQEPVWRGSCMEPVLYRELSSHAFKPAKGHALLVGDAGGLIMPVSGEGIGVGIKSALIAADSIAGAVVPGKPPDSVYLEEIEGIISLFGEIYPWFRKITEEVRNGGKSLPQILRDAYHSTLT
jgi:flavin-dependent dehydrogenase